MTDWTNEQTVAIARRVITEQGVSYSRRVWAAGVLAAAEYVMAATLKPAEAEAVREVLAAQPADSARAHAFAATAPHDDMEAAR